ncbi:hypothetical protein GCM10007385_09970 [Tateyamaria omphalii]|uniref:hypothetical protein n=1 Tax=Tateyamaria omphalii TaxID=299262 RepID=UPI001675D847|nr:hypothetical protein [Tateyamaria omphalii]GGX44043.1 hypothetical protein GCM10007385_09970 [Tateyamaria omphalii]
MIDPGLIAIAVFVGLVGGVIWSWRSKKDHIVPLDHTRAQPGRRLEGSDHVAGGGSD